VEAHQLYLKGRYLWNRRTAENLEKALNYFQQAADKDPNYALAYSGIADTCACSLFTERARRKSICRGRKLLPRRRWNWTIRLPRRTPRSLGLQFLLSGRRIGEEFDRSIQLDPNYATAHHWYARLTLVMQGKLDHAWSK